MLILLFLLLLAGIYCLWREWETLGSGVCTAAGILFLVVGCGPLALWLLDQQLEYSSAIPSNWSKQNTIVVLGYALELFPGSGRVEPGTFAYGRVVKAAELYHACKKSSTDCKVMVSGGDPQHTGVTEARVYGDMLTRLGVAADDLLPESRSNNTWQNARFSSELLQHRDPSGIWLVTSGVHLRRSLMYFSHFAVTPKAVRADYLAPRMSVIPSAYNFTLADVALAEQFGIARYHLYKLLGVN